MRSVEGRFRRAVYEGRMALPGERIGVAVSGGKDSVSLLYLMAELGRMKKFRVVALSVDEGIGGYREESLLCAREASSSLGVEHRILSFRESFGATLDEMVELAEERKTGLDPCTYCGVMRRYLLNKMAREAGVTRVATGHNLDDEVQTILLNYLRGDLSRLLRLGPAYSSREGFVPRVKPLREIPEREVAAYALLRGLKVHLGQCPYARGIHAEVRDFLNRLESRHPNCKFGILRTFEKLKASMIGDKPEVELRECEVCGEPTPAKVCRTCELLRGLGLR
ncbi:MAG: TIGR00269 family protein [Candidatus Hadarchaeales archaeon]|nr:MAG: TIGR00269 family protein [Hadesarchaea archaeon]